MTKAKSRPDHYFFRIHQTLEAICDLPQLYPHRANLNSAITLIGGKPRCLKVENDDGFGADL